MNSEVLTAAEVAALLRISTWMVYELTKRGELPHFSAGRCKRYLKNAVVDWASQKNRQ